MKALETAKKMKSDNATTAMNEGIIEFSIGGNDKAIQLRNISNKNTFGQSEEEGQEKGKIMLAFLIILVIVAFFIFKKQKTE